MNKDEHRLIHLGVAMKLPDGFEAHLVPRSSMFKKWGIIQVNHVGIIDNCLIKSIEKYRNLTSILKYNNLRPR